ncbi:putative transcriptional regulator [Bradyrhizobium diazoefficiens]
MAPGTFVRKLKKLGYTPHNAGELLGIGRSSAFKYASGRAKVPLIVQLLLHMYERHGVPDRKKKK